MLKLEIIWKKLINEIMKNGHDVKKDDTMIREVIGIHEFIPNVLKINNNLFHSKRPTETFLNGLLNGWFHINDYPLSDEAIYDYVMQCHDERHLYPSDNDNAFVYTYPERIFAQRVFLKEIQDVISLNQIDIMADRLKNNLGSNRAVANIYNCGLDSKEDDIPCLQWMQALVREGDSGEFNLDLHVLFRSNDIYTAFPSNMMLLNYLGLLLEEKVREEHQNVKFNGIHYNVTSAHIYQTDINFLKDEFFYKSKPLYTGLNK